MVKSRKYKLKLLSVCNKVIPEFDKLLNTLIIISSPSKLLKKIKVISTNAVTNKYKSSLCSLINIFLFKIFSSRKKLSKEMSKVIDKTIFWKFVEIISFKESDGKKPPFEITVILRLSELNNLIPENLNIAKKIKLSIE